MRLGEINEGVEAIWMKASGASSDLGIILTWIFPCQQALKLNPV
jgi:hypothetical protein